MTISQTESNAPAIGQRILVIDDEPVVGESCRRGLAADGHDVDVSADPRAGLHAALSGEYDLLLVDLMMPDIDGFEVLKQVKAAGVACEVVIITGYSTVESAVEAMRQGAADYLSKPFSPNQLRMVIQKVAQRSALIRENGRLRQELQLHQGFEGILGESRAMEQVFSLIRRAAPTNGTVLISGECGTGKERVARAVHRLSRRKDGPFENLDCAALAPAAVERELFGEPGTTRQGLFDAARGGTVFLDDVSRLGLEAQGALLHFLETGGSTRSPNAAERPQDVRVIAAANRDLTAMIDEGEFRKELYYQLNVVPIYLPPLRERSGDVPLLAVAFLDRFCQKNGVEPKTFSPEALARMESYRWPGNVRELRNVIERIAILCESNRIDLGHLPPEVRQTPPRSPGVPLPASWEEFKRLKQQVRDAAVQEMERRFLIDALRRSGGNVSRAAEDVGMQRTNFHALLRKYGLSSDLDP
ncbi:MAG: sigma-54-dependent Fis family transcriptional regulator [Pirellulales bacterium]|nr:sigma-54-dependent Fis family transcriptional regulator [Pirellulales bacterium]